MPRRAPGLSRRPRRCSARRGVTRLGRRGRGSLSTRDSSTTGVPGALNKEDRARRGLVLLDYLCDVDPRSLPARSRTEHPDYIVSPGADTRVITGCFLDLVNAVACIGTAV